jgi:hypothetical protein
MVWATKKEKQRGENPVLLCQVEYGAKQVIIDTCDAAWDEQIDRGHDYAKCRVDTTWKVEGTGSNKVNFIGNCITTDKDPVTSITDGTRTTARSTDTTVVRKTLPAPLDLSGRDYAFVIVKATLAGLFLEFGMGEAGYTEFTQNVQLFAANTPQEIKLDLTGFADADKNAILYVQFKVQNAPAAGLDMDFWFDDLKAENLLHYSDKTYNSGITQYLQKLASVGFINFALENWEKESIIASCNINITNVDGAIRTLLDTKEILNRRVILKVGFIDDDITEFQTIFDGRIRSFTLDNVELAMDCESSIAKYNKITPDTSYLLTDYPNMIEEYIGEIIPWIIGKNTGIKPVLIDTTTGQFKVSGLAVKSFDAVYNGDIAVTPASTNLANATFTPDYDAFDIEYTGGEASGLMTITDDFLTLWTGGVGVEVENERFDFGNEDYNTLTKVVAAIHAVANWTCTIDGAANLPATELRAVTSAVCKGAAYQALLKIPDKDHVYTCDISGVADDGSGTYTGTASALIQRPPDILHYLVRAHGGMNYLTEIDVATLTTLRTAFAGFEYRTVLDSQTRLFSILAELASEAYMPIYSKPIDSKITAIDADWDNTETVDNYYWETGKYAKIEDKTLRDEANIEDIYNKVILRFAYDMAEGRYLDKVEMEDATSQGDSNSGIDETRNENGLQLDTT